MASVSWQKMKSVQQVKAVMRHDCKDTREAAEGHTNRDLDKSQTHLNKDIMGGYADCVARYDARMGDLPKPGRKDAVVGLGYSIPVPEELPEGQEDAWCERVLDVLRQEYGSENVVSSSIHKDERHEYTDPSNKQKVMSRTHVQGIIIPESGGRLCCKEVMTRPRMIAINRKIHDMTTAEFGVEWMNGTKQKSRGTVEEMKMQSLRAENERLQEENERLQQETDSITAPVRRFLGSFKTDKEKRAADAAQQLAEAQEARKKAEEARAAAEEQAEKARRMAQEAAERAEGLKRDMEAMEKERAILEASKRDLAAKVKAGSQEIEKIRDYYGGLASGELGLDVRERGVITYLKKSGKYEAVQKEARNYFKAERGRASKAFAKKADEIERGGRKADKEADTRYS